MQIVYDFLLMFHGPTLCVRRPAVLLFSLRILQTTNPGYIVSRFTILLPILAVFSRIWWHMNFAGLVSLF